jgi:hypothetical protein
VLGVKRLQRQNTEEYGVTESEEITMSTDIRLTYLDAMLVFCLPRDGETPEGMLESYMFQDRAAIPAYDEFMASLSRLERVGAIDWVEEDSKIKVSAKWSQKIAEIESRESDFTQAGIRFVDSVESSRFNECLTECKILFPIERYKAFISR